jgi:hypothetical protein
VRGDEVDQGHMVSYVSAEERVPADHPLRRVRKLVDTALEKLSKDFDHRIHGSIGRVTRMSRSFRISGTS